MRDDEKYRPDAKDFKIPDDKSKLKGTLIRPKLRGTLLTKEPEPRLTGTLIDKSKQKDKIREMPKTADECVGQTFYLSDERGGKEPFTCEHKTDTRYDVKLNFRSLVDKSKTITLGVERFFSSLNSERKLWTLE